MICLKCEAEESKDGLCDMCKKEIVESAHARGWRCVDMEKFRAVIKPATDKGYSVRFYLYDDKLRVHVRDPETSLSNSIGFHDTETGICYTDRISTDHIKMVSESIDRAKEERFIRTEEFAINKEETEFIIDALIGRAKEKLSHKDLTILDKLVQGLTSRWEK